MNGNTYVTMWQLVVVGGRCFESPLEVGHTEPREQQKGPRWRA